MSNLWIQGGSRSGKSDRAISQFCTWAETEFAAHPNPQAVSQSVLVLSVDADQRQIFSDRLSQATNAKYPVTTSTPISFFRDQVLLFWPLLVKSLGLKAQFPILLRVENEQELAAELWEDAFSSGLLSMAGVSRDRLVRRMLDLFLLAANSGKTIAEIPEILSQGIETVREDGENQDIDAALNPKPQTPNPIYHHIGQALLKWQQFCWQNGLLTYGVITDLFGQHLLPHPQFQAKLRQRCHYLIADDVDEYPAIARDLCALLIANNTKAVFTFNPQGSVRLGLGADPKCWQELATGCEVKSLPSLQGSIGAQVTDLVLELTQDGGMGGAWQYAQSESISELVVLDTISRSKLLRNVADEITNLLNSGKCQPHEIAIIAPGLDNIASYVLMEILSKQGIAVLPLHDQQPLSTSAQVRSLLTLLTLIYANLGHLITRDEVAEMLVMLSPAIDPVRAGLLADHCFAPHPSHPKLLHSNTYIEWHRLGYQVSEAYEQIRQWIEQQPRSSRQLPPLLLLDRAIQKFLSPSNLNFDQLSALQKLIETAQHYWQISYRLNRQDETITARFIELIRQGIVSANPYTLHPTAPHPSVTLATIYQYRMAREHHRITFWLDLGSPLWEVGGAAALFAAPLFLREWNGKIWTIEDENAANQQRLQRLLRDLLDRTDERVYLCYSELSTSGQIQTGALQVLTDIATPIANFENA